MDVADIRELTDPQIRERIAELREELFRLRIRAAMMQLENPKLPREIRRDIARMKTVLGERRRVLAAAGRGEGTVDAA
ncbi:MAG: 50S ribosomal protein L29 [Gammaproteobacteria bacterium]|nr:50S ribosomal protein L29 [Gammaproteobacteria bacterium]MDE0248589.1 50S ribosomal protein L29 [Gammaproteobacteria bacterium]